MAKEEKKELGIFKSAYSSLHLLYFQEGEREKLISLFFFSFYCNKFFFFLFSLQPKYLRTQQSHTWA